MNLKIPKSLRAKQQEAKKSSMHMKRIIRKMDDYLDSSSEKSIEMASAFFQVVKFHVEQGDLTPDNVHLAALLRRDLCE